MPWSIKRSWFWKWRLEQEIMRSVEVECSLSVGDESASRCDL